MERGLHRVVEAEQHARSRGGVDFPRGTPYCDLQNRTDNRSEREAGRANPAQTREPRRPRLASGAPVSVLTSPRVLPGGPRADLRGRRWLSRVRLCDPPGPSLRGILQATSLQRAACPPPAHLPSAGGARVFRVPGPSRRVPDRERPLGSCPPAERTANVLRAVCNS